MQKSLKELAGRVGGRICGPDGSGEIKINDLSLSSKINSSSRSVLFIAIRGSKFDGHAFVEDAFSCGALAAVVEDGERLKGRPGIVVSNSREASGRLASFFYDNPSGALTVTGITGTNGKTSINWMIYEGLLRLGQQAARIGTLGISSAKGAESGTLTTPDCIELQKRLYNLHESGCRHVVLEASSHALDQGRVDNVLFDVGVFTNLTRDHLDYHASMEEYFGAKAKLFRLIADNKNGRRGAVINFDNESGQRMCELCRNLNLNIFTFGRNPKSRIEILDRGGSQCLDLQFEGKKHSIINPFIGEFNRENLSASFAALAALGVKGSEAAAALDNLPQVPGRVEKVIVNGRQSFDLYVDYAHTPDALRNVLLSLRPLTESCLWVILGCGGDRDRGKRALMARTAGNLSDRLIITSDNPRSEDPAEIINDMLKGVKPDSGTVHVEPDRRKAIDYAVTRAKAGDVILIAGKGHEDYQITAGGRSRFLDSEEALKALGERFG